MASYIETENYGSYASIDALWAAHPEGGVEGAYCTVNGVKYHWDKYDRMWIVNPNFGPTPARSVKNFDGDVNFQNDVVVAGTLRAKRIKQPCLGLFASADALSAKWPDPEVGMWALVGSSMSSTSPAAVYRCDTEGTWTATGGTAYLDDLDIDIATGVIGWVPISSTSQLPSNPTTEQQGRGYLHGTMLYVYFGVGGDTAGGKYQSAQLKGVKGDKGDPGGKLEGYVTIVNDLETGGDTDVLSAEMGKEIGENTLYLKEAGTETITPVIEQGAMMSDGTKQSSSGQTYNYRVRTQDFIRVYGEFSVSINTGYSFNVFFYTAQDTSTFDESLESWNESYSGDYDGYILVGIRKGDGTSTVSPSEVTLEIEEEVPEMYAPRIRDSFNSNESDFSLSAKMGSILHEAIITIYNTLGEYAFPNGKPTIDWTGTYVSVMLSLTNVTSSNTASAATRNQAYTTTLTGTHSSNNLYAKDVKVTMGGVDITSIAYNSSTGVVSIANVTGAIAITASEETYVTDGLVLHLDGLNRGSTSGHWVDLIGNYDFALSGTYDENADNIDFKGSSFAKVEGVGSYTTLASTLETVSKQASWSQPTTYQPIAMSNCRGGVVVATVNVSGTTYGLASYCRASSDQNVSGYTSPLLDGSYTANNIHSLVRYGGNTRIDGAVKTDTNGVVFAYPDSVVSGSFELGGSHTTYSFNGKIYAVRLYNRVLTSDEMAQNLKVDKIRFNF